MKTLPKVPAIAIALALAACGGGGGSPSPSIAPTATATSPASFQTQAKFTLLVPRTKDAAKNSARTRNYISYGTAGVSVGVYPTDTNPANAVVTNYDLTPSSPSCTPSGTTGLDACTIAIPAAPGNDTFLVTTYVTSPAQGFVASGRLSTGSASANITAGATNTVSIVLSEIVSSVAFITPRVLLYGTQTVHQAIAVAFLDAAGFAATQTDSTPFDAPVRIAYSESGNAGTNHVNITNNGGFPVGFVTLTSAADAQNLVLNYDGAGPNGYFATLTATQPNISSTPIGAQEYDTVNITASGAFSQNGGLVFTAPGESATLTLNLADYGDPDFPTTISSSNAIGPNACSNLASISAPSGTPPGFTVSETGGAGSCEIYISIQQSFSAGDGATETQTQSFGTSVTTSN